MVDADPLVVPKYREAHYTEPPALQDIHAYL